MIAQAAGRDLYTGSELVRYYSRLTVIGGLAAIVGPVLGGRLAAVTDWRGLFLFLAGAGAVILGAVLFVFRETLPHHKRSTGGIEAEPGRDFRRLLSDRALSAPPYSSSASPTPRCSPTSVALPTYCRASTEALAAGLLVRVRC